MHQVPNSVKEAVINDTFFPTSHLLCGGTDKQALPELRPGAGSTCTRVPNPAVLGNGFLGKVWGADVRSDESGCGEGSGRELPEEGRVVTGLEVKENKVHLEELYTVHCVWNVDAKWWGW